MQTSCPASNTLSRGFYHHNIIILSHVLQSHVEYDGDEEGEGRGGDGNGGIGG